MDKVEVEGIIRKAFGRDPDVEFEITEFPTGAWDVSLRYRGHFSVIQGKHSEWGLSVDQTDGEGFTGHREVRGSFEAAVISAATAMRDPKSTEVAGGQGWLHTRLAEIPPNQETDGNR